MYLSSQEHFKDVEIALGQAQLEFEARWLCVVKGVGYSVRPGEL